MGESMEAREGEDVEVEVVEVDGEVDATDVEADIDADGDVSVDVDVDVEDQDQDQDQEPEVEVDADGDETEDDETLHAGAYFLFFSFCSLMFPLPLLQHVCLMSIFRNNQTTNTSATPAPRGRHFWQHKHPTAAACRRWTIWRSNQSATQTPSLVGNTNQPTQAVSLFGNPSASTNTGASGGGGLFGSTTQQQQPQPILCQSTPESIGSTV